MKNYNKILEAVNRGIQLALDDFDDDEVWNIKSKQVYNRDYTKEYLDLMKEVVDLGLPSGTLWSRYNLGVDPNQLSKPEDWYGNYYAWAELESKSDFRWATYKYGKEYGKLTKYCDNPEYGLNGFTDTLTDLQLEDDVAYQNKHIGNYKFHIPTKEQCEELKNYTNSYWVKNYDPNKLVHNLKDDDCGIKGLNGRIFEGKNGNQLFIPAAGISNGSNIYNDGSYCNLWSSSLYLGSPYDACNLYFNSNRIGLNSYYLRYLGFPIRPAINL